MGRFDIAVRCLATAAVTALLTACGGAGSSPTGSAAPPSPTPPPASIQGVAIPASVSVVTATNAN
jgi:hypothetical protein